MLKIEILHNNNAKVISKLLNKELSLKYSVDLFSFILNKFIDFSESI